MAIEFNCPYCTAAIRVPDEFSGKRGSCPKCATKLMVPDVVPGAGPSPAVPALPPVPATVPAQPPATDPQSSAPDASNQASAILPIASEDPTSSVARSLRKKRRRGKSQRAVGFIIPLLCFFAFIAVLSFVFMVRPQELKGTLRGNPAEGMEVPTVKTPLAYLALSESEQEDAKLAFRDKPESFVSAQMTCAVELSGASLATDVEPGEEFSWYTVNPGTDVILANWIARNKEWLEGLRQQQVSEAGANLCRDKILRAAGTPVELTAEYYRDTFALGCHAKSFGFAVEAVAGTRRSLCAHEDSNGTLYFILPADTTEFILRGRSLTGGQSQFPGEYRVVVSGSGAVPQEPDEVAPSAADTAGEVEATEETQMNSADGSSDSDAGTDSATEPMSETMTPETK